MVSVETERSGPGTQPASVPVTHVRDGPDPENSRHRPDFGDEDNFPIRRSRPGHRAARSDGHHRRVRLPVRRLGGGLVEPRAPDSRSA